MASGEDRTIRRAVFSRCRRYRYALWREWDAADAAGGAGAAAAAGVAGAAVLFVALNPSTADHRRDDPTVRRCMRFARAWGFGRVVVANLFAYRTSDPRLLRRVADPVGRANDRWLVRLAGESALVVAAWGNHGEFHGRAAEVAAQLGVLHCLGVTKRGAPRHPLYVRKDVRPVALVQPFP